jgi:acyl-CoA thioester hydrolase
MPRSLQDFPAHATDKLRYADTDRQGHVNNAHFATFLETGRVEFLYDAEDPITDDGAEFVVARMELDFRGEIHWPGSVDIGTGILKIGNSSVTVAQAIYQNGRCVAEAETVIVQLDTASRSSRPLSDAARARLEPLLIDAS